MSVIDLDSPDLEWFDLLPAGAEQTTRMSALWRDDERGLRSVLVEFPDDWHRDATGNQPAQEEMVALNGAMLISGLRAGVGQLLVGAPHATRSATSNDGPTRVVVWFAGAPGGWAEGPAEPAVEMAVVDLVPGMVRPHAEGLVGAVEVRDDVAGATFDVDVDLLWIAERRFLHLAPGEVAPDLGGPVVIRHWA